MSHTLRLPYRHGKKNRQKGPVDPPSRIAHKFTRLATFAARNTALRSGSVIPGHASTSANDSGNRVSKSATFPLSSVVVCSAFTAHGRCGRARATEYTIRSFPLARQMSVAHKCSPPSQFVAKRFKILYNAERAAADGKVLIRQWCRNLRELGFSWQPR